MPNGTIAWHAELKLEKIINDMITLNIISTLWSLRYSVANKNTSECSFILTKLFNKHIFVAIFNVWHWLFDPVEMNIRKNLHYTETKKIE